MVVSILVMHHALGLAAGAMLGGPCREVTVFGAVCNVDVGAFDTLQLCAYGQRAWPHDLFVYKTRVRLNGVRQRARASSIRIIITVPRCANLGVVFACGYGRRVTRAVA